jgi:hypothetical protein
LLPQATATFSVRLPFPQKLHCTDAAVHNEAGGSSFERTNQPTSNVTSLVKTCMAASALGCEQRGGWGQSPLI